MTSSRCKSTDVKLCILSYLHFEYMHLYKLQALVYDILSPTTAIADYAMGLEKLSANRTVI